MSQEQSTFKKGEGHAASCSPSHSLGTQSLRLETGLWPDRSSYVDRGGSCPAVAPVPELRPGYISVLQS